MGCFLGNESGLLKLSGNQKNTTCWTLVYIRHGRGMYLVDGRLKGLNEGDVLFLPPGIDFSFTSKDLGGEYNINLSASFLQFDKAWLDTLLAAFPVCAELVLRLRENSQPYSIRGPKWIKISSLFDDLRSCPPASQPTIIFSVLQLLSSKDDFVLIKHVHQAAVEANTSERMSRIESYIAKNYCNKLTLEEVSRCVGMNRTYFCNFFKTKYNEGFAEYINRLRVEKAASLLANTTRPIEQIAAECGFNTVQYFTRAFRKVRNMTPGAYRKSINK